MPKYDRVRVDDPIFDPIREWLKDQLDYMLALAWHEERYGIPIGPPRPPLCPLDCGCDCGLCTETTHIGKDTKIWGAHTSECLSHFM